jgi:hypothetical protein
MTAQQFLVALKGTRIYQTALALLLSVDWLLCLVLSLPLQKRNPAIDPFRDSDFVRCNRHHPLARIR